VDKNERDEKIELYGRGYDLLMAALKEVPREMWKWKPVPKEWSVHEVIIHLADSESNAALRARKLIVEPGGTLMGYDQDKWAITLDYHSQSTDDALEIIRLVRKTTYELLKRQLEEVFEHSIVHPESADPYTFDKWLKTYSGHIPNHIGQIQNNYKMWQDKKG